MDDFDYMNGTLSDWLLEFYSEDLSTTNSHNSDMLKVINDEYIPRFERAIWMRSKTPRPIESFSLVVE